MANSQFAMAVHVLAMLANNCDERIKSGYLAESVNTNAVVIRRLLCDLHDAGLVVSQTGYSGGTCLTKSPDQISLLDVFEAVSKTEVFGLHTNQPDSDCNVGSGITLVLERIQGDLHLVLTEALSGRSLQDVIDELARENRIKEKRELVS